MIWPNIWQEPCQELEMPKDETTSGLKGLKESREEVDASSGSTSDTGSITDVYKRWPVVHLQEGGTKGKASQRGLPEWEFFGEVLKIDLPF